MPRLTPFALAALILLTGCAKTPTPSIVEVEGVVRLDGVLLKKVEVRFVPVENVGGAYIAKGTTDEAGRFTLTCKGEPGACVGENQVLITEAEFPRHLRGERAQLELAAYLNSLGGRPLPSIYANLVETPLKVDVQPGKKDYVLDLVRP